MVACLLLLSSCVTTWSALTAAEVEDEIYRLVNVERQRAGLTELARDPALDELARLYSGTVFSKAAEDSSDLRYLLANSWWATYSGWWPKLRRTTAGDQVDYCLENDSLRQAILRSDARATGVGLAVIGDRVYYTQVFDVLNAVCGDGEPVRLYDNPEAGDPLWDQLKEFVLNDDTDKHDYVIGSFVCADFAAMLHNRAEAVGIRAAYVSVDFASGPGHALNAFDTRDQGLVYVDCTGEGLNIATSGDILESRDTTVSYDKVAYVTEGQEYGLVTLDRASSFEYEFYQQWMQQWEDYEAKWDTYEQKADAYDAARGGRSVISDADEHEMLHGMYEELEALREELEAQRDTLGEYRWQPMDVVTRVYVHW
jgi:hypothetical protein